MKKKWMKKTEKYKNDKEKSVNIKFSKLKKIDIIKNIKIK